MQSAEPWQATQARISQAGIIAIVRGNYELTALLAAAAALLEGGVQVLEVTLNTPGALQAISELRRQAGAELLIGAGTVRSAAAAREAIAAGAQFTVAPGLDLPTVAFCREQGVLHLPGVLTPTEVQAALAAGCRALKLFPAELGGPAYLKALRAPFDDAAFVPTGGIGAHNLAEYINAGAVAVGMGSVLVSEGVAPAELRNRARSCAQMLQLVRQRGR